MRRVACGPAVARRAASPLETSPARSADIAEPRRQRAKAEANNYDGENDGDQSGQGVESGAVRRRLHGHDLSLSPARPAVRGDSDSGFWRGRRGFNVGRLGRGHAQAAGSASRPRPVRSQSTLGVSLEGRRYCGRPGTDRRKKVGREGARRWQPSLFSIRSTPAARRGSQLTGARQGEPRRLIPAASDEQACCRNSTASARCAGLVVAGSARTVSNSFS